MKKLVYIILALGIFCSTVPELFAQYTNVPRERRAQAGMKFLSVSVGARATAMANAMTAQEGGSMAMFYNPATMGWYDGTFDVSFSRFQWISDVTYNAASGAYNTPIGVFGINALMVDYGEVLQTIRVNTDQGYQDLGTLNPSAMAVGLGYARAVTDRFSVGGNVKFVRQMFGDVPVDRNESGSLVTKNYAKNATVYDFGILYHTGFKSLNLAMSARNFSRELTYAEESFELPLTFRVGLSMDMADLTSLNPSMHSFILSVDTEQPRDFSEQIKVGGEYTFMGKFAVRAGYIYPTDEEGLNVGFGIKNIAGFSFDYSYSQFGIFGNINRLSVRFAY